MNYPGMKRNRRKALVGVRGEVLEIGFGSGLNLPHYSDEVTRVVGVEPSGSYSRLARRRVKRSRFPVEIVGLKGEAIAASDASFDSVVSTFTMCSIKELSTALGQLRRVLKPGGRMHFLEHGLAPTPRLQRMQHRLNRPWGAVMGGCQLDVKIDAVVGAAGFEIESLDVGFLGWCPRFASYLYRGVARKA